jgi:hypothetical protein
MPAGRDRPRPRWSLPGGQRSSRRGPQGRAQADSQERLLSRPARRFEARERLDPQPSKMVVTAAPDAPLPWPRRHCRATLSMLQGRQPETHRVQRDDPSPPGPVLTRCGRDVDQDVIHVPCTRCTANRFPDRARLSMCDMVAVYCAEQPMTPFVMPTGTVNGGTDAVVQ